MLDAVSRSCLRRGCGWSGALLLFCGLLLVGCQTPQAAKDEPLLSTAPSKTLTKPNVLLIVVDDMGYTDIGAFGSEIRTPNLDQLAYGGVRLTNFHASAQCAPTRSMLMSGSDNHKAGMGSMFGDVFIKGGHGDRRGYERYLHPRVATLPERMVDAGYHTYMAGKWHLGAQKEQIPSARGFDRSFALIEGFSNHMEMRGHGPTATFREDGVQLEELPGGYYSTNTFTDKMIEYVGSNGDDGNPFFGYLALTTPHWPMQVPPEYLDSYKGQYDHGYDEQRAGRLARATELGVVPKVDPTLFDPVGQPWSELSAEEQRYSARTMELFAAMVKNLDDNVGRLVSYLKETGQFDNTLIFFMSDNGAEADREDKNPTFTGLVERSDYYDNRYENLGNQSSFVFLREGWAQASMAPYRLYKGFLTEGGTRVTSFAHHPTLAGSGSINDQYLTVMDLMPTLLDVADAEFEPTTVRGRSVLPMDGKSFAATLGGDDTRVHGPNEVIASEMHGQRSLVRGDWKIVWEQMTANVWWADEPAEHWGTWRLFNLAEDPTEQRDMASQMPGLHAELIELWDRWAEAEDVLVDVTPYWRELQEH